MANWFLMAHSKESGLFKHFCTATSDAMYIMLPGERERVTAHARATGMTEAEIAKLPRRYWRRRCRYMIPPPDVLYARLEAVYLFFRPLIDPIKSRPFFNHDHERRYKVEMAYVAAGLLSDAPDKNMYVAIGKLKTGLVLYRCVRTSSALEGYHLHLRQVSSCSSNCLTHKHESNAQISYYRNCRAHSVMHRGAES